MQLQCVWSFYHAIVLESECDSSLVQRESLWASLCHLHAAPWWGLCGVSPPLGKLQEEFIDFKAIVIIQSDLLNNADPRISPNNSLNQTDNSGSRTHHGAARQTGEQPPVHSLVQQASSDVQRGGGTAGRCTSEVTLRDQRLRLSLHAQGMGRLFASFHSLLSDAAARGLNVGLESLTSMEKHDLPISWTVHKT